MDTVKAHRKRLRRQRRREINGRQDRIFLMIVFVPCGLVPIGIKPFTYCGDRSRKLSGAYPDGTVNLAGLAALAPTRRSE
jgi:hypothetical protein